MRLSLSLLRPSASSRIPPLSQRPVWEHTPTESVTQHHEHLRQNRAMAEAYVLNLFKDRERMTTREAIEITTKTTVEAPQKWPYWSHKSGEEYNDAKQYLLFNGTGTVKRALRTCEMKNKLVIVNLAKWKKIKNHCLPDEPQEATQPEDAKQWVWVKSNDYTPIWEKYSNEKLVDKYVNEGQPRNMAERSATLTDTPTPKEKRTPIKKKKIRERDIWYPIFSKEDQVKQVRKVDPDDAKRPPKV